MDEWEYDSIVKLFYDHHLEGIDNDKVIEIEKERLRTHALRCRYGPSEKFLSRWLDFEVFSYSSNENTLKEWYEKDDRRFQFIDRAYNELDLDEYDWNTPMDEERGIYYLLKSFGKETLDL